MTKEAIDYQNSAQAIMPTAFGLPEAVFREYDIRGYAETEIDTEFARRLGTAMAAILHSDNLTKIYVGRDCRLSSPTLAQALKSGLLAAGIDVIDLGMVTTSALNFAICQGGDYSAGIMVTASHNPREYNGFKIIVRGQVIAGETLQRIKSLMISDAPCIGQRGREINQDIISDYLQQIVEDCSINPGFKIVIDAGNGAAGPLAVNLFRHLGAELVTLFCEPDGNFPNHDPNPSDEGNLQQLIDTVVSTKSDLGLAFDGDGDRLVVITGDGEIIWPDKLMMIFARDILHRNSNAQIVYDVKSSRCLEDLVRQYSGTPVMCKTGHAHVRKAVHETGAVLGGEFSGHIFFNDRWHGFDDGLYAAARLLEILSTSRDCLISGAQQSTLNQVIGDLEKSVYTPELLIPVRESIKFKLMQTVSNNCRFKGANIITIDGLRVEYPKGWGLIRASNTSAYLTMRFEADNSFELERIKELFRSELSPFINNMEQYF